LFTFPLNIKNYGGSSSLVFSQTGSVTTTTAIFYKFIFSIWFYY
jgi:hypothetical protein